MSSEILRFAIAAGETKVFEKAGRYLEIITSADAIDLDLYDAYGSDSDGAAGALSGMFLEGAFSRFNVRSTTAQNVELLLTDGRGGSRRQPGVVQVIDAAFNRTVARQAFLERISAPAVAAQWAVHTVYNPPGSGKILVIESIWVGSSAAGLVSVCTGIAQGPGAASAAVNKYLGGAASIATHMTGTVAAQSGSPMITQYCNSQTTQLSLKEPIVVPPGSVWGIQADTQNMALFGAIEYFEQAI